MKLYHGTITIFDRIQLVNRYGNKDFGLGFYTTDSLKHAKERANGLLLLSKYRNGGNKYVCSYNVDKRLLKSILNVKEFTSPTAEWLDLIVAYRAGICIGRDIDVIIGPTADSSAMGIINNACKMWLNISNTGDINLALSKEKKEKIVGLLKTDKYGMQYCFKTQKAIEWLQGFMIEWRKI